MLKFLQKEMVDYIYIENSDDKFKLHFPQGGTLKYKQMCLLVNLVSLS